MKIVKDMIQSPTIPFSTVVNYKILENTIVIIEDFINQKQDWCADSLIQVLHALIEKADEAYEEIQLTNIYDEAFDIENEVHKLFESLYLAIFLVQHSQFSTQDKAS